MQKKNIVTKTALCFWLAAIAGHAFANLSANDLKNFGDKAELRFATVSNFGQEGTFDARVTVNNHSFVTLPKGKANWKMYIHSVKRILSTNSTELTFKRLQGDLYELAPTDKFLGLEPGKSLHFPYKARGHIVSYSDFMPRAFIANTVGDSAVFANTDTENLAQFVDPFTKPEQFLRFDVPHDLYPVVTTTSRYQSNLASASGAASEKATETATIIPTPKTVAYSKGSANIDGQWKIVEVGGLAFESDYLQQRLRDNGLLLDRGATNGSYKSQVIQLIIDKKIAKPEAYELNITSEKVMVSAASPVGIFYGVQSFLSLLPAEKSSNKTIPALRVFDEPRAGWRGMHYDLARNFHGKEAVLELIEQMGRYKLNKLHLHLTEDEGWRIEIPGLSELTDVGAFRCFDLTETQCLIPQIGSGPNRTAAGNGYLTTTDFTEIVKYAAQRHIDVIPEIDMPGHSRAAIKSMEARYKKLLAAGKKVEAEQYLLSDPQDKSQYLTVQSYSDNSVNVCLPSTYAFIDKVTYELQQMYRKAGQKLSVFHMGGDEVGVGSWTASPACNQLFTNADNGVSGVADLKPYFVQRVSEITHKRGLDLMGWEDGLMYDPNNTFNREQLVNKRVIANAWDNIWEAGVADRAHRLANNGYDVVISGATHLYFDHPHEPSAGERGYHWATRYTDLAKVFGFMPDNLYANADRTFTGAEITNLNALVGRILPPLEKPKHVLGMQGQVWTETIRTKEQLQTMIFPRVIALAERAWFKANWEGDVVDVQARNTQWNTFAAALVNKELPKLEQAGVTFYLPPPGAIRVNNSLKANTSLPGLLIEFSRDGGKNWLPYPSHHQNEIRIDDGAIQLRSRLHSVVSATAILD
ncbi:family 20 glycosylhydrolase [Cellvibrio sp. pealriver]|uniref:family 20 glycosylhydrolase n=1 Tax=Cellvibrio sp. pealriver TaxID=1622269 RepID=UPI0009E54413|nr:family 20 glycosylhydrolase [Cellvibrio sp. pealriver]